MVDIKGRVEGFLLDNMLLGDVARMPAADESLVESGVIDSTGILELIEFIEQEFGVRVEDTETVPDNLDGVDRICAFVVRKLESDPQAAQ